ncbi:MAG: nucleoside deaminase [Bacteroidetes bacterium]|nr:nucleoside deaminase [Bacteroidota bacterium]
MVLSVHSEEFFMKEALKEAQTAFEEDEIPVGAIIVFNKKIIARAHNLTQTLNDVTAHAEMQAITAATNTLGTRYLNKCTLYVTLEPCPMCAGALFWAQIGKIIYGASDPKRGFKTLQTPILHPSTKVKSGILQSECKTFLKRFFKKKR